MKFFALLLAIAVISFAGMPRADTEYVFPLIQDYGGVVRLDDAAQQPRENSKVVLDITSGEQKDGVLRPLIKAARIANLYAHAGVGPKNGMEMAIILHGDATKAALADEAYQQHEGKSRNPNGSLVQQLKQAGAEVYVCGQALAHHDYARMKLPRALPSQIQPPR